MNNKLSKKVHINFENILKKCGPYSYGLGVTGTGKLCINNFSDFTCRILGKENVERFLNESEKAKNRKEMKELFVRIATNQ